MTVQIAILALGLLNLGAIFVLIRLAVLNLRIFAKLGFKREPDMPKIAEVLEKVKRTPRTNTPVRRSRRWLERLKSEVDA